MVQVGTQPIGWSNDDFRDLGAEITLERCLSEMREAGYSGTELGHKFPKDARVLKPILDRHKLALISAWHSSYLLSREFAEEEKSFREHLGFLKAMGCKIVIVAECTRRTYDRSTEPLHFDEGSSSLSDSEWERLARGLDELATIAREQGLEIVYHHHMGTVIQNRHEIDRLMRETRKVRLLLDTGHLSFAGVNPLEVLEAYSSRIAHVHLKDVRAAVAKRARTERFSFEKAVREGVFTVPGDGSIDYKPIFDHLKKSQYPGWLVVEAEQDPSRADPLEYAKMGRETVRNLFGV